MGNFILRFSKLLLIVFVFNLVSPGAGAVAGSANEGNAGNDDARNNMSGLQIDQSKLDLLNPCRNGEDSSDCRFRRKAVQQCYTGSNDSNCNRTQESEDTTSIPDPCRDKFDALDNDASKDQVERFCIVCNGLGKYQEMCDNNSAKVTPNDDRSLKSSVTNIGCPDLSAKQAACSQAVSAADNTCDSDKNGELNSANGAASQIALQMGGITNSNIAVACSNFADVSKLATGAFASYQAYCLSEKLTAQNVCNELDATIKEINPATFIDISTNPCLADAKEAFKNAKAALDKMQTRVNEAQTAMKQLGQTTLNAQQCECMTAASQTNPKCTGKFDPCTTDPNSQLCLMSKMSECNLPGNASTPLCICNKNPNDPICPGSMKPNVTGQGVANNGSSGGGGSSSGGTASSQAMFDNRLKGSISGGPDLNMPRAGFIPGEGGAQNAEKLAVSGGGNNSLLAGSGVNASGGRKGGTGKPEEKDPIKVNAGFRSGGGSGFGGPGGSPRGGSGGGYGGSSSGRLAEEKVDLRQFLPNGKYDPRIRGIAGLRQNPDGITGPHSDIWMKIKARYLFQMPSLNP